MERREAATHPQLVVAAAEQEHAVAALDGRRQAVIVSQQQQRAAGGVGGQLRDGLQAGGVVGAPLALHRAIRALPQRRLKQQAAARMIWCFV